MLSGFRIAAYAAAFVASVTAARAADEDWEHYRHDTARTGEQQHFSALADPAKVPSLAIRWQWPPTPAGEGGMFYASPIVINGRVFIGSTSGRFYAIDAKTGSLLWTYPPPPQPPLIGSCGTVGDVQAFGAYGILSSASAHKHTIIFGAPDPDPAVDAGLGSGRLYALDQMTGALVWKSDVVARVNGCNFGATGEQHERIAYSSPLVHRDRVYIGIHDAGDDPIQNGKLIALNADNGHIVPTFNFVATSARGGGIWNAPTAEREDVLFTTGNTKDGVVSEPVPNRGLSMIGVEANTGAIRWQFQPVPYELDDDPDWAAGVTLMPTTCGRIAASVMKDGWSYALDAHTGSCRWQFPDTVPTADHCRFPASSAHVHGDTDYKRPGAAWRDVLAIVTGGEALVAAGGVNNGYGRLHGLNVCAASPKHRVRWIADVPHSGGNGYSLGAPTVTHGIFYIATDQGHVVAVADPAVAPAAGVRCSQVLTPVATCTALGFSLVYAPAVLADVALTDGSDAAGLRNEPAIAGGRLFVATQGGHVYMLSP
jgi:outer membrane protein assembly factor BamB